MVIREKRNKSMDTALVVKIEYMYKSYLTSSIDDANVL